MTNKATALAFLDSINAGKIREAYDLYASSDFRHHNAHFKSDLASLRAGMEDSHAQFPNKVFKVQRSLEDGPLVAVHSEVRLDPGHPSLAVVHLFRFENYKIAELWDLVQFVPDEVVNELGMF